MTCTLVTVLLAAGEVWNSQVAVPQGLWRAVRSGVALHEVRNGFLYDPAALREPALRGDLLTKPPYALIRYELRDGFQGRLAVTIADLDGRQVSRFEVLAVKGVHHAIWELRRSPLGRLTPRPSTALEQDAARAAWLVGQPEGQAPDRELRTSLLTAEEVKVFSMRNVQSVMIVNESRVDGTTVTPGGYVAGLARLDGDLVVPLGITRRFDVVRVGAKFEKLIN